MKKNSKVRKFTINAKEYSVKLTKVCYMESMSDETNCFTGVLQVKCGKESWSLDCSNEGRGGETYINHWVENREIYNLLTEYLKKVPNQSFIDFMKQMTGQMLTENDYGFFYTLEDLVDQMCEECIYG